jgi:Zn-dependent protease
MITKYMMEMLVYLFMILPACVVTFTVRGFCKALLAKWCGDTTPEEDGFLSLNPVEHVNFFSLTVILLFMFAMGLVLPSLVSRRVIIMTMMFFGMYWSYPITISSSNFRNVNRGIILTSLAGPIGCFVLVLIALYTLKYAPYVGELSLFSSVSSKITLPLYQMLIHTVHLASWFGVLELIPLPPFDASKILPIVLPPSMYHVLAQLEEYALYVVVFIFLFPVTSEFSLYALNYVSNLVVALLSKLVF